MAGGAPFRLVEAVPSRRAVRELSPWHSVQFLLPSFSLASWRWTRKHDRHVSSSTGSAPRESSWDRSAPGRVRLSARSASSRSMTGCSGVFSFASPPRASVARPPARVGVRRNRSLCRVGCRLQRVPDRVIAQASASAMQQAPDLELEPFMNQILDRAPAPTGRR